MPLGHKNLPVKYIAVLTISSSPLKIMDKEIAVYIYPQKFICKIAVYIYPQKFICRENKNALINKNVCS